MAITRVLLDKKSICFRFWRFTFFDISDIFSEITNQNCKKRNAAITRVLLDKKFCFGGSFFFDIGVLVKLPTKNLKNLIQP